MKARGRQTNLKHRRRSLKTSSFSPLGQLVHRKKNQNSLGGRGTSAFRQVSLELASWNHSRDSWVVAPEIKPRRASCRRLELHWRGCATSVMSSLPKLATLTQQRHAGSLL